MCSPSDPISLCYDQHEGTDFALSVGTPVKPAAPGLVVEVCKDPPCGRGRGYGRYVLIDHENGYATLYAHLQSVSVVVGKRFYPNTPFEPLGTSGRSGGDANIPFSDTYWNPHLHFGLYFDLDNSGTWTIGEEVDPYGNLLITLLIQWGVQIFICGSIQ
jgi:murein DD-endopeptidase MepM/ murein hydrolase activator NlpD